MLLAWVAAFSAAIGFLVLQQVGASFMSGKSMAVGVALGRLEWASVLARLAHPRLLPAAWERRGLVPPPAGVLPVRGGETSLPCCPLSPPLVAEPPLPFPLSLLGTLQTTQSGREETTQRYPQGNHAADGDSLHQQD